ncbi:MAG: hypothetical protein Q4G22_13380 [Paracoccus sp. (in: a-proteobacteria)]|uniref:hypothetical protein n=1 Tax=Paracoccus sp. TaxID=267 RepID=UPI0026E07009|nr:hypothetical protein [Paracoccus sp. (in: a-proteobacteria)]MDO5632810.1 hypothetical protein [Paracoccus sp. (in: a-proteobacteria)]
MPRLLLALPALLVLAACDEQGTPPADTAQVFKSFGTTQCNPAPERLETLAAELTGAGITVLDQTESDDGMMRITLCGSPDGRIGVFTIPSDQTAQAETAGFQLWDQSPPE